MLPGSSLGSCRCLAADGSLPHRHTATTLPMAAATASTYQPHCCPLHLTVLTPPRSVSAPTASALKRCTSPSLYYSYNHCTVLTTPTTTALSLSMAPSPSLCSSTLVRGRRYVISNTEGRPTAQLPLPHRQTGSNNPFCVGAGLNMRGGGCVVVIVFQQWVVEEERGARENTYAQYFDP